uniref:Chitin-binding type-2 domain-containing protein n=1 Tax=Lutzomyia longipalpis TaxID=7200 RepID=A0A1B0CBD8_LUTLO
MKLILMILFFVTSTFGHDCPEDPEEIILWPDPEDCSKYYKCTPDGPISVDCPEGHHFNAETKDCDWPEEANCEVKSNENEEEKPETGENGTSMESWPDHSQTDDHHHEGSDDYSNNHGFIGEIFNTVAKMLNSFWKAFF